MKIVLNGAEADVEPGETVGRVVDRVVRDRERVAVERNRAIVRRDFWDETAIEPGDVIEVVTLVGGG